MLERTRRPSVRRLAVALAAVCACPSPAQEPTPAPRADIEARAAFGELVAATHWRQRNAARDALAATGAAALPVALDGTHHESEHVREICHEVLRAHFPTDERAVEALLAGLRDASAKIRYANAFHVGEHRIERGVPALRALLADDTLDERTRFAAAKSLGELGAIDVVVMLWQGLGSDDAYTRYLSNLGVLGLCGKDLSAFGYESPWEGAFVSGPVVGVVKGQPLEKARRRAERWQAIVQFTEWLQGERPKLFAELEGKLW